MINLAIVSRNWSVYETLFYRSPTLRKHYSLVYAGSKASHVVYKDAQVILGNPNIAKGYLQDCESLEWFQSTWAGNNGLQDFAAKGFIATGIKGVFAQQMSEYVMAYLLYFARNINGFEQAQQNKLWYALPRFSLQNKTLGILGLGDIGQAVARTALSFNMRVLGLAQSNKDLPNIECFLADDLHKMCEQCDYIVNFLPETPRTKGLCNNQFFNAMPANGIFINAGRGSVIDSPNTILHALRSGQLRAAVLDVFDHEPLPSDHPFYTEKNLYITNHTAAESQPQDVFAIFQANALKFSSGETLQYMHDFSTGY